MGPSMITWIVAWDAAMEGGAVELGTTASYTCLSALNVIHYLYDYGWHPKDCL